MNNAKKRMKELGVTLPTAPVPVASYLPAVRVGDLVFVSGQLPFDGGGLVASGPVPSEVVVEDATRAARQCVLNALAVLAGELQGNLDRVRPARERRVTEGSTARIRVSSATCLPSNGTFRSTRISTLLARIDWQSRSSSVRMAYPSWVGRGHLF